MSHEPETPKAQATNIDTVVRLESEGEERISRTHRASEAIGSFAGTNAFVLLQLAAVALWAAINTGALRVIPAFDPYPFPLLAGLLALEAVLLTAFVLISQKRMSERADRRSHLDLQINLLAEKEATKIIQLLQGLSRHMGMDEKVADPEARELAKDTAVEGLVHDLHERLEKNGDKDG